MSMLDKPCAFGAPAGQHRKRREPLCLDPVVKVMKGSFYCAKHARFQQMRDGARRSRQTVPSYEQLEVLASAAGMVCSHCRKQMFWTRGQGPISQQITLQHDRSGIMRLICMSCNSRHRDYPGDDFYKFPVDFKRCYRCKTVKPFSDFSVSRRYSFGLSPICRRCLSTINADRRTRAKERNLV
jgi:hypothetical protein